VDDFNLVWMIGRGKKSSQVLKLCVKRIYFGIVGKNRPFKANMYISSKMGNFFEKSTIIRMDGKGNGRMNGTTTMEQIFQKCTPKSL
jgi:hypothetical protein